MLNIRKSYGTTSDDKKLGNVMQQRMTLKMRKSYVTTLAVKHQGILCNNVRLNSERLS